MTQPSQTGTVRVARFGTAPHGRQPGVLEDASVVDAARRDAGPGGHSGAALDFSAAGLHPHVPSGAQTVLAGARVTSTDS
jgi:hypothetical protein